MANRFKIKRGSESPNNSADIENYELVYNYTDNELWTKHNGSVVKIASGNVGTVTNVVAGNGLTGGGTTSATLDVGAGTGISIAADSVSTNDSQIVHDNLSGFVANEHINHSGVSILAGTGLTGGGTIASSRTLNVVGENGLAASANAIGLDLSPLSAVGANNLVDEDLFAVEIAIGGAIKKLTASSLKTYIGGGTITSVSGMTNNNVLTASGSTTISGESNLTFDGTDLAIAATGKIYLDGGGHTYISESANDLLDVYVGGTNLLRLEESGTDSVFTTDNVHLAVGTHKDLRIYHNSSSSNNNIENHSGSLYITNEVNDADIILRSDDGSGGVTPYLTLDGSATLIAMHKNTYWNDDVKAYFGSHSDAYIYYEGTNDDLYIRNANGDTKIRNEATDADIIFSNDDGSGGNTNYMVIDGGAVAIDLLQDTRVKAGKKLFLDGGGNTYIFEDTADRLRFFTGGAEFMRFTEDSSDTINLYQPTTVAGFLTIDDTGDANEGGEIVINPGANHSAVWRIDSFYGHLRMFSSTTSGEQFRFTSTGNLAQLTGTKHYFNGDGGNTYIDEVSSGQLRLVAGGTEVLKGYSSGAIDMYGGSIDRAIQIGANRTGNANSYIDFIGDTTYTDYGLRIIRWGHQGVNAQSVIYHRGTGDMIHYNQESAPHIWYVNSQEKMRIDSSGNIGIGTNSPGSKLHVQNGATSYTWSPYAGTTAIFEGTSSGHSILSLVTSTTGNSSVWFGDTDHQSIGRVRYEHANNQMEFWTNGIERMAINSSGNVGIGTSSPGNKLEVRGDIAVAISDTQDIIKLSDAGNDGSIELYTGEATPVLRTKLTSYGDSYFNGSSVKLGIGTSSPAGKLDVYPDTDNYARIGRAYVGTVGHADFAGYGHIDVRNGSSYGLLQSSAGHTILNAASGQHISFRINNNTADMMRIDASGNVGIGTTSPSAKLEVNGTSNFTGEMYIDHGGSDYAPGISFMGGSNTPGANTYENARLGYYDNSGTGLMRFSIGRGAGNFDFLIGGNRSFIAATTYLAVPDGAYLAAGNDNDIFIRHDGNGHLQSNAGTMFINQVSNNSMILSTSNTERIRINGNGNIGIANTTPYEKLDVKSASSTSPAIVANGAAVNGCVHMAHGYAGQNGDYVNTYGSQYSSNATVLGYGVKPSTTANDTFLCSADNAAFVRGALVIDDELRFWQGAAANGTLNNNFSMTERFRLTAAGVGHFDNDVVAYSSTVSDKRLKENITTINNALDKVQALRGVEYDWTATSRKGTHDIGLVAQEVEEVLPELVTEHELCTGEFGGEGNEKTFKTVNYDKMVGVLIEAIKEQQVQIDELKTKLGE